MHIREQREKHPQRRAVPAGFADSTWSALAAPHDHEVDLFDPASLHDLPAPAQRLLSRALPANVALSPLVRLDMDGEIKLGGRWFGFTAQQILRAGIGFVWAPVVGGRILRFTGADALGLDGAQIEFKLHGLIPVMRASGTDVHRSAQGRLAAETVAWLPQALTPQAGARWVGIDDERAVVTISAAGTDVDVQVAIDDDGQIRWIGLDRWNSAAKPPAFASFGGSVNSTHTAPNGVCIAGRGAVGWDWHTPAEADGVFFHYSVTAADFSPTVDSGATTRAAASLGSSRSVSFSV
ncbi:DUF6544 family protein [Ilumatobacter sp.]|uniref:DUF6544 family protein n=1 Tax=Ilumatobacter sp. TaxID=1967498 RepID=UPI003C6A3895